MDCCFVNECERFAVTPVLVSPQVKCCESAPIYVPCCNDKVVYCCEKIRPCTPVARKICYDGNCDHTCTLCSEPPQKFCPTCRQPTGPPAKPAVKYVMPCYRYEDGRIVQNLPVSAFKRNGMQDQEHSKLLGTANFLYRCRNDIAIDCDA
ncbi:PREDICTED: uncharacterized protein LOC106124756 isoform X3 [Papilio xuthus]|uniref:Uncharacterized protein LOC106124756 isoform X3 n=1 Tax=Papilio xuthus TaxID=66420 RepID=A0AAJ6ZQ64_PAPXU|nr:PREDICTED: uncharacterized protein LOC106124756 isoform X3 [Papilio xuthus]